MTPSLVKLPTFNSACKSAGASGGGGGETARRLVVLTEVRQTGRGLCVVIGSDDSNAARLKPDWVGPMRTGWDREDRVGRGPGPDQSTGQSKGPVEISCGRPGVRGWRLREAPSVQAGDRAGGPGDRRAGRVTA